MSLFLCEALHQPWWWKPHRRHWPLHLCLMAKIRRNTEAMYVFSVNSFCVAVLRRSMHFNLQNWYKSIFVPLLDQNGHDFIFHFFQGHWRGRHRSTLYRGAWSFFAKPRVFWWMFGSFERNHVGQGSNVIWKNDRCCLPVMAENVWLRKWLLYTLQQPVFVMTCGWWMELCTLPAIHLHFPMVFVGKVKKASKNLVMDCALCRAEAADRMAAATLSAGNPYWELPVRTSNWAARINVLTM